MLRRKRSTPIKKPAFLALTLALSTVAPFVVACEKSSKGEAKDAAEDLKNGDLKHAGKEAGAAVNKAVEGK